MQRTITRGDLKKMGFSDPWPSETMSKLIPTIKYGILPMFVYSYSHPDGIWYVYGFGDFYKEVLEDLKEEANKYVIPQWPSDDGYSIYPRIFHKEEVENICIKLTGKSIYEINIPENPNDRIEGMKTWAQIEGFGRGIKTSPKRKWYQIF